MITQEQADLYGQLIEMAGTGADGWKKALATPVVLPDGRETTFGECTRGDLEAIALALRELASAELRTLDHIAPALAQRSDD